MPQQLQISHYFSFKGAHIAHALPGLKPWPQGHMVLTPKGVKALLKNSAHSYKKYSFLLQKGKSNTISFSLA